MYVWWPPVFKTDKAKTWHWLFGGRVLTDEKSGQNFLRSIFNPTHHFVLLCLDVLAVWMAFVRKRCGGKFGRSVLVDSSPKLIFGTWGMQKYSRVPSQLTCCVGTTKVKIMVSTRRGDYSTQEKNPPLSLERSPASRRPVTLTTFAQINIIINLTIL
jgi:hypothetical protein